MPINIRENLVSIRSDKITISGPAIEREQNLPKRVDDPIVQGDNLTAQESVVDACLQIMIPYS